MKTNFDYFKIQKSMSQTVRAEKLDQELYFLQFCADLNKKSKSVRAIYIYASERSHDTVSENGMAYRSLSQLS